MHPGAIRTELSRHLTPEALQQLIASINASQPADRPAFRYKTVPQGAATTVWSGIVAPGDLVGGLYCEDCHVAEIVDSADIREGVRPYALDPENAKALWAKSEEMVRELF